MNVGLNEYAIFNRVLSSTDNLFSEIDKEDWEPLVLVEYSFLWAICEQTLTNMRNQGYEQGRIYNIDESYSPLTTDHIRQYWSIVYPSIYGNRDAIFNATLDYAFNVQLIMCSTVAQRLFNAHLDELELSALLLLLFTRPACFEMGSKQKTHTLLHCLRNSALKTLASHIQSVGKANVDERMGEIIFLLADFQNLVRLVQHSMRLLMKATNYAILPDQLYKALEQPSQLCTNMVFFKQLAV